MGAVATRGGGVNKFITFKMRKLQDFFPPDGNDPVVRDFQFNYLSSGS